MPKFNVSYSEILHYLTTEIEARDEDEARDKFLEEFDKGNVEVNKNETYHWRIEEIK